MSGICPSCGTDLALDEPFTVGDLSVDPRGITLWRGAVVPLTAGQGEIVLSLAREAGRFLKSTVLGERMDSDSDHNVVQVLISRIRDNFEIIDPGFDRVETMRGLGYRWRVD